MPSTSSLFLFLIRIKLCLKIRMRDAKNRAKSILESFVFGSFFDLPFHAAIIIPQPTTTSALHTNQTSSRT